MVNWPPKMHCTLLIPNLLWPRDGGDEPYRDLEVPALTRLLARGRCTRLPPVSMEAWLCAAFEVERQQDWPVAPLTLMFDGGEPGVHYWLRCDPVHLRTQRSQLQLVDAAAWPLAPDEAQTLAATLNDHFAAQSLVFQAPRPGRWYLRLTRIPALSTHALPDAAGKDINGYLPEGEERMRWHQTLNEIQMLLHDHPVNQAREARNEPAINSVWLWGGGVKPAVPGRHYTSAWSDDALGCALPTVSGIPCLDLPGGAAPLMAAPASDAARTLAVIPQLRAAASGGDVEQWRAILQALEQNWFAPLHQALRERRIAALSLVVPGAGQCTRYDIASVDTWKFWRTPRALHAHG
jgi:hypothetical protein